MIIFALDDDVFEADIKSVEDIPYSNSSTTPQRTATVQNSMLKV
jgi:hypothetical protein